MDQDADEGGRSSDAHRGVLVAEGYHSLHGKLVDRFGTKGDALYTFVARALALGLSPGNVLIIHRNRDVTFESASFLLHRLEVPKLVSVADDSSIQAIPAGSLQPKYSYKNGSTYVT